MKFSIKDLFTKCNQIPSFLRFFPQLFFCAVKLHFSCTMSSLPNIVNSVTSTILQIPAMVVRKVYFLTQRINANIDMEETDLVQKQCLVQQPVIQM